MTFNHAVLAECYGTIFESNSDYTGRILQELDRIKLSDVRRPEAVSLVSRLLTVLHDLDESAAAKYIDDLKERSDSPALVSSLNVLSRFKRSNYRISIFDHIEILEENKIDERYRASEYVRQWLANVPVDDIEGIRRIYLLASDVPRDYSGNITIFFSVISIVWDTALHPRVPMHWLLRLHNEQTLYHEIGHHRHKHQEGGSVPEQEDEANAYARKTIIAAHPYIAATAKALSLMFRRKRANKRPEGNSEVR